ncbi:MAG TPA: SapC family protein [Stellaceae bacterium]|nr:SapC family protein [Stellaceae bacterium]
MAENDPSASSSMPAATAEGAAPLPLFYRRPAPLSALRHFGLSLSATDSFAFARDANAIPLNVSEFSLAARHYPIVFTPTDPVTPVAVVGIAKSRNLFVDAAGKWLAGAYIPAYVRRYPFLFIEDKEKDEFILGIDDAAKALREEAGEKDRLFWEGKPTSLIERAMAFCKEYQSDLNFTRKFCAALEEDRLLADKEAGVALKDGKKFRLTGFRIVDEAKFDKLPAKPLLQLRRRRFMHPIYLHMISTANWATLVDLAAQQGD